jgi:hypothetical protein
MSFPVNVLCGGTLRNVSDANHLGMLGLQQMRLVPSVLLSFGESGFGILQDV